jgi:hypothetical protein
MTDIVERLRTNAPCASDIGCCDDVMAEAADEIERLLTANDSLRMEITALLHIADRDEAEIERLRTKVCQLEDNLALTRAMLPTKYKYEVVMKGIKE